MRLYEVLITSVIVSLTSAHFELVYPPWRGDSFEDGTSQWLWPCANVSQTNSSLNRTTWPTQGGSLVVKDEHDWALTYVNIGLGNNVTSFNVSLIAALNQTSNGTLCIPSLAGEAMRSLGATNGANASIQVVTINAEGNALYNCADITFSDDAQTLSGNQCQNSTGVDAVYVENRGTSANDSGATGSTSSPSPSSTTGAANIMGLPKIELMLFIIGFGGFMAL